MDRTAGLDASRLVALLLLSAVLAAGIPANPAVASTIPRLDFQPGQHAFGLALADVSYDYALADGLAVGVAAGLLDIFTGGFGPRCVWRVAGSADGPALGLSASVVLVSVSGYQTSYSVGFQPTVVLSVPLLVPWLTVRGQLGPYFWVSTPNPSLTVDLLPVGHARWESGMAPQILALRGLELAVGPSWGQLVLGGGAIAGVRAAF